MKSALNDQEMAALKQRWLDAWPQALAIWSKYTQLKQPIMFTEFGETGKHDMSPQLAAIRLLDQTVMVNLLQIVRLGLNDYALEILAHEIGHHVLAPCSARDQFRLLGRIRRGLPTREMHAPMVANLYTDLYINDRLQRQAGLRMAEIYPLMNANTGAQGQHPLWQLYMRIYEKLWKLDKGTLGIMGDDPGIDTDAWLGARLIRVYANDWLVGAGRFAALVLPYVVNHEKPPGAMVHLLDTKHAAVGCDSSGAQEVDDDEAGGAMHPMDDPVISGIDDEEGQAGQADKAAQAGQGRGQLREPFEYGAILKAAGMRLTDEQIAIRYYRERALPHLVPFPVRITQRAGEPEMEATEPWDIGDALDEIDWMQTLMHSPRPIPGMTTMRRTFGSTTGQQKEKVVVDLDMYVDSSGSMPNPSVSTSYLALAGAIIALSALKAGASVQVTLWSGVDEVIHTEGFVTDSDTILGVLTAYFGRGTAFPIHQLRKTYSGAQARARPAHILMISDDGITTMFGNDELGNSGWDIAAKALAAGGAGGTMALNIPLDWKTSPSTWVWPDLRRAESEQGWDIHAIAQMEGLITFARAFSRRHYTQR